MTLSRHLMILIRSFHRTKHSPCVALVLIVLAVVLGCVVLVAGIAALGVVEAVAMTVQAARGLAPVAAVVPVPAVVMVPAVALVGVTDVPATALLLAEWTALVDVAVVLLHVEAAPEFAEMVVGITAEVIAVVVLMMLPTQAPALKLINLED